MGNVSKGVWVYVCVCVDALSLSYSTVKLTYDLMELYAFDDDVDDDDIYQQAVSSDPSKR
jgi:hypothetical protein